MHQEIGAPGAEGFRQRSIWEMKVFVFTEMIELSTIQQGGESLWAFGLPDPIGLGNSGFKKFG
jgi:hypothetical protein